MGMGTFQIANQNVVQSEIFNKIQLELNATPYYSLPDYPRFSTGVSTYTGVASTGLSYFNAEGEELIGATAPAGTVYIVRCTMTTLAHSATPADGLGMKSPPSTPVTAVGGPEGLVAVNVQIGFHATPVYQAVDARVAQRTFVIAKRDTSNGS
jgi:hypothetical protein